MNIRQIVLDTETTGLLLQEDKRNNRIVQIACVELVNGEVTGRCYQRYINPERESNDEALRVHGLTTEFLADKPKFIEIVDEFLDFIKGAELIIHNAPFDIGFLNHELNLLDKPALKNTVIDTRIIAQQLYSKEYLISELVSNKLFKDEKLVQAQKAKSDSDQSLIAGLIANPKFRVHSLDHLCQYFDIDLSAREKYHGALVDCELLAQVYLRLKQEQLKQESAKQREFSMLGKESNSSIVDFSMFPRDQTQKSQAPEPQEKKPVPSSSL